MRTAKKGFLQKTIFVLRKRPDFSIHAKPTNKEKPFFSTAKFQFSTAPKLTCSYKFHPRKPCCELAVQQPFFETSQSCVSTKATLSHRFKSSPSIPGKVALSGAAGYMMTAGHFRENHVSSGDLHRPPSPEVRKPLGYSRSFRTSEKNKLVLFAENIEVLRTSIQLAAMAASH